ncbi:MAG: elongation factor G [Alphaproteobacteria bacterium]|nr:elongation factor G [Alphaproteobacteria bacterium]
MTSGVLRSNPGPRAIALVGPYLTGKTTLLESILHVCGATSRKGSVTERTSVGDSAPEARAHMMSIEANVATCEYLGDSFTFIDCPGSIEFIQDSLNVVPAVDAAVIVCEPDQSKLVALQPYLHYLQTHKIPHFLFVNKIDQAQGQVMDMLAELQPASVMPLVLRQLPIWNDGIVNGFIDLALERAYIYREHAPSEMIEVPGGVRDSAHEARYGMLERLADYDDALMEELLSDIEPARDEVFSNLSRDFSLAQIVPVLLGSAMNSNGVRRLLKAIRHEVPGVDATTARLKMPPLSGAVCQILKTYHTQHGGKLSVARVLGGPLSDGDTLYSADGESMRVGGMSHLMGHQAVKCAIASAGETVALGRLEQARTGDTLAAQKGAAPNLERGGRLAPVYSLAVAVADHKDEVKLTGAITRISEEDPSIQPSHEADTHEIVLHGQGEMHLRIALERLRNRYGLSVQTSVPKVPYCEAIRKPATQRGRHKRQSGGHGQFGDVVLEIAPLPRGSGFVFEDRITGGVVLRNYIPGVEAGVRDYLQRGPLGFPVVDIAVALIDGSYHTVDSSEQAFRTAARIAMQEAMPNCAPVLLEPILHIEIVAPAESTARVNGIVASRRGHILGFDARPGWPGWDMVAAQLPQVELQDLITELRSVSQGVGSFTWRFDHLQELTGRLADEVVANAKAA